jgi:hypothetical protein
MYDSEKPTDPNVMITQEDILSYLVGAVQRIESQLASEEPPPWAEKLFSKLHSLETEVQQMKGTCAARHQGNGQMKLPII